MNFMPETMIAVENHEQGNADLQHINLQLAGLGQPICEIGSDRSYLGAAYGLLKSYSEHRRLLSHYRSPPDQRIQDFLADYFRRNRVPADASLPADTFVLDEPGLARKLSLPQSRNDFHSPYVHSYRILQGVLHNPRSDRRTTQGFFHIAAGGLPVPFDKREVPAPVFAALLSHALNPPQELLQLPITSEQANAAHLWVSLLLRPLVSPAISGVSIDRRMEIRAFAPGSLVANLDFLESIFGNAGDPFLLENDAALDIHTWTGHTGCIILAPHLLNLHKKSLGLPHISEATPRQLRDRMYWETEADIYNDGEPFKVVCRDMRGVIVTIVADNYFGYSKKEVKSQISYSANLLGGCEEEHSGGAIAFPRYNLGENFQLGESLHVPSRTFEEACELLGETISLGPSGYAVDKRYPDIIYIPENARFHITGQKISWESDRAEKSLKLLLDHTYVYPCGYRVHLERHPHAPSWRLIGTVPDGVFCHKPSTVSGGGKSEISKSLESQIISGPFYVGDIDEDLDQVADILARDYSGCCRRPAPCLLGKRSLLSLDRTLGSVIKLLTPSPSEYTDEYNQWLEGIPQHILALVFLVKRFYRAEWGSDWRSHFSVDSVNGYPGHELKCDGRKLIASYLRVGFEKDGTWRVHKLRQDFIVAEKLQTADDISVSAVVPVSQFPDVTGSRAEYAVKLVDNCEAWLFQRPDDAVYRGRDLQTEADLAGPDNFISNFQPLTSEDAKELVDDAVNFSEYSEPMQSLIRSAADHEVEVCFVSSAHPRLVDGKPSKNPRYLQPRSDLANARGRYLVETAVRLAHAVPMSGSVNFPVDSALLGRRNNPATSQGGARSLAVYGPIHYQELPELFMDLICSLTGKSPSTTGAGSEGALTKGPFNAISTTADLNTALVSFVLCGYGGFSTPAGYIGEQRRIDHDISLLIPEIWSRLPPVARRPEFLIENDYLQKIDDFEFDGRLVFASRLGYRITERFVHDFLGKVFDNPIAVFDEALLKPELQDLAAFVDGIDNISEAQRRVALGYFKDESISDACPPLQALLHIMAFGSYEGKGIAHPDIRSMFTRDSLLESDWYRGRLLIKKVRDEALWSRHVEYIEQRLAALASRDEAQRRFLIQRLNEARRELRRVASSAYLQSLHGTLGADWIHLKRSAKNLH